MSSNSTSSQILVLEGEVLENLPNTQFRVLVKGPASAPRAPGAPPTQNDVVIICYLSGKMRKNFIKILPGDKVKFEITAYDTRMGRIIFRQAA